MWRCVEVGNKVEKKKKKKNKKDEKRIFGCFETFRHSFSFSLLRNQNHFNHSSPNSPKILLSLIVDEHTNIHLLTHIYHTNQQPSMSSLEFKSLPNFSFSFSKQHTQSHSLSPQNNHFSCESSKSISSSLLSHSSHLIQECD